MMIESGTCNVCSAPCSSCMHYNRSISAIKNESGFSGVICVRGEEADSSSAINLGGMPSCKSRICDDLQHVASETSNLLSTTSSHDSCFENADSKANFRTSTVYDASDYVDMPQDVCSREFVEEERPLEKKPGHGRINSHSNTSAQLGHGFSSGQGEEQSALECHGDNLLYTSEVRDANVAVPGYVVDVEKKDMECSNMTINSSFEMNVRAIPNEGGDGNHYNETRQNHSIESKLTATGDASLLDNNCNSASVNTVSFVKSQLPSSECDVSPEESIRRAEVDNVESSFASVTAGSEHKFSAFPNHEVSTPCRMRSGFSSGKIDELCQETRTVTDREKPFDNGSKRSHLNAPLEKNGTVLDATKGQGNHALTQSTTEGENSDSDALLDDVKVCDICGDAGREDLLAICSRCSDGAEHTYCMNEMLHKVPEGNWLCEECKIKEMKNQNVDECEAVSGKLNSTCLNEASQNALNTLIPKKLPKLDTGPTDFVTQGPSKGLQSSHISTRRQAEHPEEGKGSDRKGASLEIASPRKNPVLSRQFSLKNQTMEKVKTTSMPTLSEVQSAKGSEAFSRYKASLSSSSFKGQPHPPSPHGFLSRSVSFSYSNSVPKVKTLFENAPHKQKITRESTTNDLRKEGLVKSLTRTTSFKNATSGRPNTESTSKSSSFKPSLPEGLRGPKEVKERSNVERKNISAMQNSLLRPSAVVASNYSTKVDAKSVHSDGKIKSISETDSPSSSKTFNDANDLGSNEGKKQASYSSKSVGYSDGNYKAEQHKRFKPLSKGMQTNTSAIDGSNSKVDVVSPHSILQFSESGRKDDSMRDSPRTASSRFTALGGAQKLRCQRCNETGHVTQHCSVDKLRKSTNKLAAEGNSSEVVKKPNKWREIVNAAISRSGELKGTKPGAREELQAAKANMNCEAASKNAPSAFIQKTSVSILESINGKDTSKDLKVDSTKNIAVENSGPPAILPVEVSYVTKADDLSHSPTIAKFSEKPFAETLQYKTPLLANALRPSAIPKLECIWQGSFNVLGTGNFAEKFNGIQAHLSSSASNRVFEAAIKVPGCVQLEEVSHINLWSSHFQRVGPQEENIALFFFAKDAESYERSYRKLMDRMHKNDLSLKGNIDGVELYIFTSNKLPMNSQRWNLMYYLWGMFRAKRKYGLPVMGGQKKPSVSNLDMELPNQDLPIAPNTQVCNVHYPESRPSKILPGELADSMDLLPIASGIEDKASRSLEDSLKKFSTQMFADPDVPQGQPSFPVGNFSRTTVEPLRVTDSPKSMVLMSTSNSCSEEKNDGAFQKKFVSDCANRKTGDMFALADDLGEESSLKRASSVPLGSPNCNQGDEFSSIEGNLRDKECSTSSVAIIDDDDPRQNVLEADCLNNKKRGRSCSIERVLQHAHGMSNSAAEMVQLRERQSWISMEDDRELKKNCYADVRTVTEVHVSNRLSSKIHPLYSSILTQQIEGEPINSQPVKPVNSRTTERCFFPTDLCPVQNNKSANIIHIPSSDDEETPESCTPDLELALGGKSKSSKPAASPLPFASAGGKQHMQLGFSGDDEDDLSASLSLSLGFPAAERERSAKNIFKKEQVLPEKPQANTSLLLFGRFNNS